MKDRAAAFLFRDGRLLLIRRDNSRGLYYVLPGGSVEAGETPDFACARELFEETQVRVTTKELVASITNQNRSEHYFHVTGDGRATLSGQEARRDSPSDSYDLVWVPTDDVADLPVRPGAIVELMQALVAENAELRVLRDRTCCQDTVATSLST